MGRNDCVPGQRSADIYDLVSLYVQPPSYPTEPSTEVATMKGVLFKAVSTASLLCYLPQAAAQRYGGGKSKSLSEKLQASITTKG